jgi:hypothetical protein
MGCNIKRIKHRCVEKEKNYLCTPKNGKNELKYY